MDAAWLTGALAQVGDPRAACVSSLRVERIGIGYGLDGTLARVTTTGPQGEPGTFVAKWCRHEIGVAEARFYREIAPHLDIGLTRLVAGYADEQGALLLLEDVAPARQGDAIVGATPEEALGVVEAIASFHARFWGRDGEAAVAWLPRWGRDVAGVAGRTRDNVPRFVARFESRLSRAVLAAVERLPQTLLEAHAVHAEAPATLLHGDLHLDNVLFRGDGSPVVIDWATASRGPGAVDLVRFLVEGLTLASRRALEPSLRRHYVESLRKRGIHYDASHLDAHIVAALHTLLAGAVRFKDDGGPNVPARLGPIIDNLVTNAAGAYEDHVLARPAR